MDLLAGVAVFFLVGYLMTQWGDLYLRLGTPDGEPTASDVARYWITAVVIFALLIFGWVVATRQARRAALVAYPIVFVVMLCTVVLFSIPRIDWSSNEPVYQMNPNYCSRTDSENCPGG
jgi:glycerol uptake facilitator-like aquaporin